MDILKCLALNISANCDCGIMIYACTDSRLRQKYVFLSYFFFFYFYYLFKFFLGVLEMSFCELIYHELRILRTKTATMYFQGLFGI